MTRTRLSSLAVGIFSLALFSCVEPVDRGERSIDLDGSAASNGGSGGSGNNNGGNGGSSNGGNGNGSGGSGNGGSNNGGSNNGGNGNGGSGNGGSGGSGTGGKGGNGGSSTAGSGGSGNAGSSGSSVDAKPATDTGGTGTPDTAAATVSFKKDIGPIMETKCKGCHSTATAAGGYAWLQEVDDDCNGKKGVDIILSKVDPTMTPACGAKMPKGGTQDAALAGKLKDWIAAGAPNN